MITITNSIMQDGNMKNEVKFNFNNEQKSAECKCGNKWKPTTFCDYRCHKCDGEQK